MGGHTVFSLYSPTVPYPAVASDPELQCVRTRMGIPSGLPAAAHSASAPKLPMALFAPTSSASISSLVTITASAAASPRFAAVGRLVQR